MDSAQRAPLSFAQQEAWLQAELAADLPVGNQPVTIHRRGPLDAGALEGALADLVRRHETWRTTFRIEDGAPVQVVNEPTAIRLLVVDLRGSHQSEREALALATADAERPFDRARGPLYRARLVRLADDVHGLYLTLHAAIADGASIHRRLLPELAALYAARVEGRPPPPGPPLQQRDVAVRQREWARTSAAERQLEYWRRQLAGPPPILEPSADRARPPVRGFRGARLPVAFDRRLSGALHAAAREVGVSVFVVLLAGFAALLHRYTGEDDVVVGSLAAGRTSPELQALFGCLANPLALRIDLAGDPSFRALLRRVDDVARDGCAHGDVPFEHVVKAVQPIRDRGRSPLFSHVLTFEPPGAPAPPGWEISGPDVDPGTADFDLHLDLYERRDAIVGRLGYRTDLFEPATIVRLEAHYRRMLEGAAADLDRPVSRLPLLDERERHQMVVEWNRTARPYPAGATVHELVERHAARAPERVAVVAGDTALTYRELNRRADVLAARLRALGVAPGAIVGVAMERSPEVIVGYLAALKAGAAYLPLSVNDPPERLAFIVTDAGAAVVLTRRGAAAAAPVEAVPVVEVGDEPFEAAGVPAAGVRVTPDDPVYVMYTSGSTGRPKGVAVPHRGIVRLLFNQDRYVRLGPDDVILQSTALSFDVSAFEIWGALVHGARLVLYPAAVPTVREIREAIRRHGVTTMWLTPAVFNMVIDEDPETLAPLRQLDLGGEALSVSHVARAASALRTTQLINGYGPTECSVAATAYLISPPVDPAAASIPIGPPIANTTAYVLDRHLSPVPVGVPGELYLGGPGVARGYVNRPEETAARFIEDPFRTDPGARLYRTGDRARWRPDGTLEYLGRLDAQVKIRGLRIELGEIETVLNRHPAVREAAVVVREDPAGKRLVAYVVAAGVGPDELREHVRRTLPVYMVPASFVALDALPLTPNGKLDRRVLTALVEAPIREGAAAAAPPAGSLEAQLIELWQQLLGARALGVSDDFFELGGDSLTAARMLQQVGDLTGCALPLTALYESPTIAGLARVLSEHGERSLDVAAPALVLNQGGDRTPLFLFHGMLTGGAFYALRLARRLGPRQPIHVIHPFTGGSSPIPSTIEAMVDAHLDVVRGLQPRGPYRLAGYCNGGLVAYETARRLRDAGEAVELLALIAAAPVTRLRRTGLLLRRVAGLTGLPPQRVAEPLARLRSFLEAVAERPPRQWLAFVARTAVGLARRAVRWRPRSTSELDEGLDVMALYHRVFMRFFPAHYPGEIVLLWPEREGWGPATAAADAWRRLVPVVTLHVLPGDHLGVLHEHLDVVAGHLNPYLVDGDGRPGRPMAGAAAAVPLALPLLLLDVAEVLWRASELSICVA
jgi:amino acid adenylation domain-containing protein